MVDVKNLRWTSYPSVMRTSAQDLEMSVNLTNNSSLVYSRISNFHNPLPTYLVVHPVTALEDLNTEVLSLNLA